MTPQTRLGGEPEADRSHAKRAAREQALSRRDALSAERRGRLSAAICARAAALPELEAAETLLLVKMDFLYGPYCPPSYIKLYMVIAQNGYNCK